MKRILLITFSLFLIGCSAAEIQYINEASLEKYQRAEAAQPNTVHDIDTTVAEQINSDMNEVTKADFKNTYNDINHGDDLPNFKKINNEIYQTVKHDGDDPNDASWIFKTWQFDQATSTFLVIDETVYNDDTIEHGYELGQYWYDLWKSADANYHPYHNLTLTEETLIKAAEGKLIGVEHPIGTNISTIKEERPPAMEHGFYEGSPYLFYPEDTYFYNEDDDRVTAVAYKGDRLKITLDEVEETLGTPTYEGFNEMENEPYFLYEAGEYTLYISGDKQTQSVRDVILTEGSWFVGL
ncbi:hypothetical protein BKP35_10900 [Anaerobacillus arseniciselenatis]|uniref:Lipoprotein n=1 Tax=Anaerobacillus arseniciselenatis TaxID=85682 RepID=A0A1S2LLJ2_9BACI|nr:DUF4309 domain-containing protein [Anaerobacillus arseniciselenatis]OIJ12305.1 hypothetical protein BKP35_10900 [Anaerobacillus arseniciselenatis]